MWDLANMRPVLGLQLLMAQVFLPDVKLNFDDTNAASPAYLTKFVQETGKKRVTDVDLKSMAGNTMTVQVMGIIQAGVKRSNVFRSRSCWPKL
jgi:hypothetical protein